MFLFTISLFAGVLTILTPCVLPLLPVIVGGTLSGETKRGRALTVTVSLSLSVILFTLILKVSTLFINIPQSVWTWVSGGIVLVLGIVTVFPTLWDRLSFIGKLNRSSNKVLGSGYQKQTFRGDVIVGMALGPVFSSCSPTYFIIIATVLPQSFFTGLIYLIAYAVGLGLALLIVASIGQRIIERLGVAANPNGWFKKTLGVIFIIVAISILTGFDKKIEQKVLESGLFDATKIEQRILESQQAQPAQGPQQKDLESDSAEDLSDEIQAISKNSIASVSSGTSSVATIKFLTPEQKSRLYKKSAEITNASDFVNTDGKPIKISDYLGKKVVLLDIWTYTCINCKRTLPYIVEWNKKYEDKGLVIIGVHTPEFGFEKILENVRRAVDKEGITYPVVLDNNYGTWNAFKNNSWPRKYLIDIDGYIVYDHSGEGAYDYTEKQIQKALEERNQRLGLNLNIGTSISRPNAVTADFTQIRSPETYFGAQRNEFLGNGRQHALGSTTFVLPAEKDIDPNTLYLSGAWQIKEEYAEASQGAGLLFVFYSKNVYMVASSEKGATIEVYIDGKLSRTISIKEHTLYPLVSGDSYSAHRLEVRVKEGIIDAYTFTFG